MKAISLISVFALIFTALIAEDTKKPNEWEGKTIPQLVLESGKTYSSATITKIEPDAITITHSAGMARIPMEDLQQSSRDALGYDAKKAAESRQAHIAKTIATDRANDSRIAAEKAEIAAKKAAESWYKSSRRYYVKITQVLADGILAYVKDFPFTDGATIRYDIVFMQLPTSDYSLYDGWYGTMWAVETNDTYSYTDISGARRTLKKYIFVPEKD